MSRCKLHLFPCLSLSDLRSGGLAFPPSLVESAKEFRNRQIKAVQTKRHNDVKRRPGEEDIWDVWKREDALTLDVSTCKYKTICSQR